MPMLQDLAEILELDALSSPLRRDYHELTSAALKRSPLQLRPFFIHLAGVPGSGKSTYSKRLSAAHPDAYLLDFDGVMESLPAYRQHCEEHGLESAFRAWEIPARLVGYRLLISLLEHRRSIIFDHSASNPKHIEIMRTVSALGYRTEMHYLPCQPELALARIESRSAHNSRFTPAHLVIERAEALKVLIPNYRSLVSKFVTIEDSSEASSFNAPLELSS
ncbi:MAG: zeta toxin family protein [Oligoflexia bacterium]|nr:zeta toxin family protein [Oligoflexia bacterium]